MHLSWSSRLLSPYVRSRKRSRELAFGCDFRVRVANELGDRPRTVIAARAASHRDRALRRLAIPDDQHVGDLLELRFANFIVYLFLPRVDLDAQARRRKAVADRCRI